MERYENLFCQLATGTIDIGSYTAILGDTLGTLTKGEAAFYLAYKQLYEEYRDEEKHPEVANCLKEYRILQKAYIEARRGLKDKWTVRFGLRE